MKTKNQSKFRKHGKGNHSNIVTTSEIQNTKTQKLNKNKKRKITKEETAKHILELREILNQPKKSVLKKLVADQPSSNTEDPPYRIVNGKKRPPVEVVKYMDHTKVKKNDAILTKEQWEQLKRDRKEEQELRKKFSMNSIKYDVQKLGISGMEGADKQAAKDAMAIKLGAMPRKKKHLNIKEFRDQQETEGPARRKSNVDQVPGDIAEAMEKSQLRRSSEKTKMLKTHGGFGYSQLGRYKDGYRTFTNKEIKILTKDKK